MESGLESVKSRSISDVKWQQVPDRRAKMREVVITFHHSFIEWEFYEAGISTGAKILRRRAQMQAER